MNSAKPQSIERPPIVVVMGHVDHGKSTLLDFIRKSNTVDREAGGITQHVAAYEVERTKDGEKKKITFIDTPGHAAFSTIRARGANVADIAILVVAADDGVKAQTLEALAQIREAGIPYIVAINKMDKPNADLNRTQATLMEQNVFLEKLGGDVPWAAVSAKIGTGVEELLDLILLVAEIHELKAHADVPAKGYIIEANRDQKRGLAATLIITEGTLENGMTILAGRSLAPVRIMENHIGKKINSATFSSPVRIVGFDELPNVGTEFQSFKSKRDAEAARSALAVPERVIRAQISEEDAAQKFFMPVILRADMTGSLEAIIGETARLGDEYSRVTIVQSGLGDISENDIKTALAGENKAVVIGFNVGVDPIAQALAQERGINTETFSIIYKLTERLEEILQSTRPKRQVEEIIGKARVLKQFSTRKDEQVIGGSVTEGRLDRKAAVRVMRRNAVVGLGKIKNIQTNKQDVDRADTGTEFGAQIEATFNIVQGDTLECFKNVTE